MMVPSASEAMRSCNLLILQHTSFSIEATEGKYPTLLRAKHTIFSRRLLRERVLYSHNFAEDRFFLAPFSS